MDRVRSSWIVPALVGLITLGGGVLRVAASHTAGHRLVPDERAYGRLAIAIDDHLSYGDPGMPDRARWAPGAPVAFALARRIAPAPRVHQRYEVPGARRLQALCGTATIAAAAGLAALLAGPVAAVLVAAAVAFYPPLISIDHFQLSEPVATLLVTLSLLALAVSRRRHALRWSAAAGALLGLAVLTRADLLLAPVFAGVALWLRDRRAPPGWRPAAVLVAVAVLVPWTAFASWHRGHFVPVSDGGPGTLFMGSYLPGNGTVIGFKRSLAAETRRRDPRVAHVTGVRLPAAEVLNTVAARDPGSRATRRSSASRCATCAATRSEIRSGTPA